MLKIRHLALGLTAAAVIFAGSPAVCADASAPAGAPSAQNLALAKHLFAEMHMDQMMSDMMKNMVPAVVEQARKANPSLSADQAQAITDVASQSAMAMMDKLVDRMIPLYASTFTEKELRDSLAFYDGPSGQAMLSKMPLLMSKMTPMMIEMMPEMQADMRQRLCAKINCSATGAPAAPKG